MTHRRASAGFIRFVALIVIGIVILWLLRLDLRRLLDADRRAHFLVQEEATMEYYWYSYLAWYDSHARTTPVLRTVQAGMDNLVRTYDANDWKRYVPTPNVNAPL